MPSTTRTGNVVDGLVGRQRERPPGRRSNVEPWRGQTTVHVVLVPVALAERPVVVRAAILDREELAAAVVDADERPGRDDELHRAGGNSSAGATSTRPRYELKLVEAREPSGSGVPFARCSATFRTPARGSRTSAGPASAGSRSPRAARPSSSPATSLAFRPCTISVSIDVAACEIAQPRPSNSPPRSSRRRRRT